MSVAVIILNYNNYEDTINCICSIEHYNTASIKYIVVDNCSKRVGTCMAIRTYIVEKFKKNYSFVGDSYTLKKNEVLPRITFLASETNDGYAKGNNKGLKLALQDEEIDYILVLNNDILFVADIIPNMLKKYSELKDVAILTPLLYKKNLIEYDKNCFRKYLSVWHLIYWNYTHYIYSLFGKTLSSSQYLKLDENQNVLPIELPSGACMLIEKKLFAKLGFFDSNTFLYYEENILYEKIRHLNLKNYLSKKDYCIHLGASSTHNTNSLWLYDVCQNSSKYYVKNYSGCNVFTFVIFMLSCFFDRVVYVIINTQKTKRRR